MQAHLLPDYDTTYFSGVSLCWVYGNMLFFLKKKWLFTFIVRAQKVLKPSPAFLLLDSHQRQQAYNLSLSPTPSTLSSSCEYLSNNYYKGGWTRKPISGLKSNIFAVYPLFSPDKLWPILPTLEQPSLPNKRMMQDS